MSNMCWSQVYVHIKSTNYVYWRGAVIWCRAGEARKSPFTVPTPVHFLALFVLFVFAVLAAMAFAERNSHRKLMHSHWWL